MAVVTISRRAGSGAEQIAQRACELLGYDLLDKNLMAQVAADVGLSGDEIIDFSETDYRVKSFVERLLHPSPHYVGHVVTRDREASDAGTLSLKQLNESECIELIRSTLRAAYHRDNMVILGRGGQAILQKMPGALHVRVEAPWRARVVRIGAQRQVGEEEARQMVLSETERWRNTWNASSAFEGMIPCTITWWSTPANGILKPRRSWWSTLLACYSGDLRVLLLAHCGLTGDWVGHW